MVYYKRESKRRLLMKLILTLTILLCTIGSPALAALTDADLDKIRLIVKEEVKAEITEAETRLRTEIAQSEEQVKIYIDAKFEGVDAKFEGVDAKFESLNAKFESLDKRLTLVIGFVSGLIILIVVTVGIPQIIMAWRGKNERAHERRIEKLAQEIETLKQRLMVKP